MAPCQRVFEARGTRYLVSVGDISKQIRIIRHYENVFGVPLATLENASWMMNFELLGYGCNTNGSRNELRNMRPILKGAARKSPLNT